MSIASSSEIVAGAAAPAAARVRVDASRLSRAQETLLIPLWARAVDAVHPEPILGDRHALELVEALDYPFSRFADARVDAVGFCIRGAIFDRLVGDFLQRHPDGVVVELGPGLDARFERVDNGRAHWFEVDLPDAMDLRRRLFDQTDRRRMCADSVLNEAWLGELAAVGRRPLLFVAEGMLYFLARPDVERLLRRLAERFPGSQAAFDCQSPLFLWLNNLRQPVRDARMRWSLRGPRDLARWQAPLTVEKSIGFGDRPYYEPSWLARLPRYQQLAHRYVPGARRSFSICQVRLGDSHA